MKWEKAVEALANGKAIRLDDWDFGTYVQIGDVKGVKMLVDEDGYPVEVSEECKKSDKWIVMRDRVPMNELNDKALWYVVREMVFNTYVSQQGKLLYSMTKFARDNKALSIVDSGSYVIVYDTEFKDFIIENSKRTFTNLMDGLAVRFNSRDVAYRALEHYKEDMVHILELSNVLACMQLSEIVDLNNTPYTRAELEDMYKKLGGRG